MTLADRQVAPEVRRQFPAWAEFDADLHSLTDLLDGSDVVINALPFHFAGMWRAPRCKPERITSILPRMLPRPARFVCWRRIRLPS